MFNTFGIIQYDLNFRGGWRGRLDCFLYSVYPIDIIKCTMNLIKCSFMLIQPNEYFDCNFQDLKTYLHFIKLSIFYKKYDFWNQRFRFFFFFESLNCRDDKKLPVFDKFLISMGRGHWFPPICLYFSRTLKSIYLLQ